MIAPAALPGAYQAWNRKWHAPYGRPVPQWMGRVPAPSRLVDRYRGPFGFQPNSSTRRFEYPWAFHAVAVGAGMTVVDLGGALSGFQFALASTGSAVVTVDPFLDYGSPGGYGAVDPSARIANLNRLFGTKVQFRRATLTDAALASGSIDTVYCISTLEHLAPDAIDSIQTEVQRVLTVGGHCVVSVDLFLDLAPFTKRATNRWGANLDVRRFVERSGLELAAGDRRELCGFPEFDAEAIQSNLSTYLLDEFYPGMAQCLVLRKVSPSDSEGGSDESTGCD